MTLTGVYWISGSLGLIALLHWMVVMGWLYGLGDIFWVIEYSNSSLEKDLGLKDKIYARANISEYWVVNLKTRELIVFRNPVGGEYQLRDSLISGTIYSESFLSVQLEVARLVQ